MEHETNQTMIDDHLGEVIPMTIELFVMLTICLLMYFANWLGQRHFQSNSNGFHRDAEQADQSVTIPDQHGSPHHFGRHGRRKYTNDRDNSSRNQNGTASNTEKSLLNKLQNETATLKREQSKARSHKSRISELQPKNNSLDDHVKRLEGELEKEINRCKTLHNRNKRLEEALEKATEDKDDALRRLSQYLGERLVQNNPNVADLSDPYRPSRLAEMSNEIYDNEWTSAFTWLIANEMPDNVCVTTLLNILMRVHSLCQEKVNGSIQAVVTKDEKSVRKIKDVMKENADSIQARMYKEFYLGFSRELQGAIPGVISSSEVNSYIESCFKLCWYMAIQDPPCVFQCYPGNGNHITIPPGTELSRDYYKAYTKRGAFIDFIVWPILMLDINEPIRILSKGVAEGRTEQASSRLTRCKCNLKFLPENDF